MIKEQTNYVTEDNIAFDNLPAAERHQANLDTRKKVNSEQELRQQIYKNLFEYIQRTGIGDTPSEDILDYLVLNKKEIILLLTNGNLDTVYTQRTFTKETK